MLSLILALIAVLSTVAAVILGLSLRKYQKISYEKQVENRKLSDEFSHKIQDKEAIITQHETQLSDLEKKIQGFDVERQKIYQQAIAENATNNPDPQYQEQINSLTKQLDDANKKNNELLTQGSNFPDEKLSDFKKEITTFQDENFDILDKKIDFNSLQILNQSDNDNDSKIPLLQIIESSSIEKDKEYITTEKPVENDQKILSYVIIFAGNAQAFLIDGELSHFLIKNYDLIKNNADKIKKDIDTTLKQRIDFLNSDTFKTELIKTVNQLENIATIDTILPCIYLPSENIANLLHNLNPKTFSYALKQNIYHYTPAGLMNLILHAKSTLSAEKNIIKFQILSDIVTIEEDNVSNQNTENNEAEQTDIKSNNSLEQDNITEENHDTNTDTNIDEQNEEPVNTKEAPIDDEQPLDNQKNNIDFGIDDGNSEMNVDKLNIGTFLDGGDINNDADATPPTNDTNENNTYNEDEISHIVEDITKENPIDESLNSATEAEDNAENNNQEDNFIDENIGNILNGDDTNNSDNSQQDTSSETQNELPQQNTSDTNDTNNSAEEQNLDNPDNPDDSQDQANNTPTNNENQNDDSNQNPPEEQDNTDNNSSEGTTDDDSASQKEKSSSKSDSFKNIDPKDFDIEAFLNES